jgi:glycosyltransferase involved in cell wall biosynthesis
MFRELAYKAQITLGRIRPLRFLDLPPACGLRPRGRALVSYLPLPLFGDPGLFRGHSNVWESSEIARIFTRLGYCVDVIAWQDKSFIPTGSYDVVFDIHCNLLRYSGEATRRIIHVTGSYPDFSNRAERQRLDVLQERRGVRLQQRRGVSNDDLRIFSENLEAADTITLIGNGVTFATFPEELRGKIKTVNATGALLPLGMEKDVLSAGRREFLWFNGAGAVHKGLDLVLEVFARHAEFTLHVVGPYLKERDFVEAYRTELFRLPNILSHGFLYPGSAKFQRLLEGIAFFINPSCSEGISTAAITCMQAGLVPIASRNCGISLPKGIGWLLQNCSIAEIEEAVLRAQSLDSEELGEMSGASRRFALKEFSREAFSARMEAALSLEFG